MSDAFATMSMNRRRAHARMAAAGSGASASSSTTPKAKAAKGKKRRGQKIAKAASTRVQKGKEEASASSSADVVPAAVASPSPSRVRVPAWVRGTYCDPQGPAGDVQVSAKVPDAATVKAQCWAQLPARRLPGRSCQSRQGARAAEAEEAAEDEVVSSDSDSGSGSGSGSESVLAAFDLHTVPYAIHADRTGSKVYVVVEAPGVIGMPRIDLRSEPGVVHVLVPAPAPIPTLPSSTSAVASTRSPSASASRLVRIVLPNHLRPAVLSPPPATVANGLIVLTIPTQ